MSSAQPKMSAQNFILRRHNNIYKSPEDQREYRGLELTNGLKVLLISDPTTDKSAAALDVNAGHLMDPWELPGTAHFCEHMLFLGTDKYPSENEYSKFISAHAGSTNAYTAADHTNYHFDVKPDQLEGALDRFVQFFLAPQFTESATEREVCAVDSEHSNNLKNDGWRKLQVERFLSKPGHDYGKFGTGNKKTLMEDAREKGIEPREALLKFHKQWYSSNIMSLCIVGTESLDQMEAYLGTLGFDAIENKDVVPKEWLDSPYDKEQLRKRVEIVPIKDSRSLMIRFPIPDLQAEYKSNPAHYISHLLGHEGKGSLLSELKRLGWVSSLSAGETTLAKGFGAFDIHVDLSVDGINHTEDIVALVFSYIGLLKRTGAEAWVQEELKELGEIKFRFKDKENPMALATKVASEMRHVPFEDILSWRYLMSEFKPERIMEIVNMLSPENMFYTVVAKQFSGQEGNIVEPVYGTEMRITDIDKSTMDRFKSAIDTPHPALHMPEQNEYIPTKFEQKPRETVKRYVDVAFFSEHPRVIYDDVWCRIWFKQDDEYKLPKMVTKVAVTAPIIASDPRATMLSSMYLWCLNDALAEETYNAELAGLKCQLELGTYGTNLKVTGYDEKQPLFVEHLVKRMTDFKPDPLRFEVLFDAIKRALENFAHSQPYTLSQHYVQLLLSDKFWSKEQLLAVCKDMTVHDVEAFGKDMLRAFHVELFVHGNATEQEALSLGHAVAKTLREATKSRPLFRNEYVPLREHALENGDAYVYRHFQNTHEVSCVEVVYQAGVQATRENALVELLVQLLREPAFNQLRTIEQLGYIVWTGSRLNAGTLGLQFIVQGPKNPDHVLDRIEAFIDTIRGDIVKMSDEEFEQQKTGLITRLLEKPKTLGGRFRRFWNEIECRQYDFDRNDSEVEVLRNVTKEDLLQYFDRKFSKTAPERRKVAVFVHGKDESKDGMMEKVRAKRDVSSDEKELEEIECMEQFRQSLSLYGRPRPKLNLPPIGAEPLAAVSGSGDAKSKY
ncbi:peptidase, M16 family [Ancylostoma caninum]|uniref:Insulin-degrading enzyme n=1 Tax=Ancylostoma caninum TaxID=29170 RepID=A0A368G025_ANCCA|nr:peptidase, M16 family [Ancylostoma caninum]